VLEDLVGAAAAAGHQIDGVGLSSAGPIDTRAGTVSPINIAGWDRFPLVARVAALVDLPVVLAGDGTATALAEQRFGAARGIDDVLVLFLSTGIGAGLVLGGRPFLGRTGNAGHFGHLVVEPDGAPCTCGGRGCLETVASGPNSVRWAHEQGWEPPLGSPATGATLGAAARAGDSIARAAVERAGRAVGEAVAGVAAVADLSAAVVGGGFAQTGDLLLDPLREAVARHARLSFLTGFQVLPAGLGTNAAVVGAAALIGAT
jgi:glucokinase